jgi:hypothetical protein
MVTLRVRVDAEHAQLNRRLNPQVCGCGAAGFTCALHFIELGVLRENLVCVDVLGVVYAGRDDLVSEPEKYGPTRSTHPPPPARTVRSITHYEGSPATAEPNSQAKASRPKQNAMRGDSSPHTAKPKPTHTHQHIIARTLTHQHGSHRQCRGNDATELAHADMTTLPKVDTICTALSLMPTVIGNTFAASLRTDISPQRKEARPRLTL